MKMFPAVVLNAVPMICWTAIAIYFDRWYLALFALLFRFDYRHVEKFGEKKEG